MWYVLEDDVPANTTHENARETKIRVGGGILHTIVVDVPPRVANTTKWQLWKAGYCIMPRNEDKWMEGEFADIEFREWFELRAAENTLALKTYNDSELHPHKVRLLIGILPKHIMEIEEQYLKTLNQFMRLFRRRT